ncbi:uncharacterized protein LOC132551610 [Ylistrum balloti]|uniref:uncharacterized protein LOC132551610 n=1 Tax=Ylistrum balloti TaxID=509963 RepID=UPI002905B0D5|nr:uncharacterized protein LOC132551610 [Ylistrum balloti]XP_060071764.1 uncharacterized protein LOC132551610 [Ylistrum balloti]XP_060071765.1 uncharacterized protein LOC132551610 [Ylistrum balloti]XP_060071766.1 uncharacterized protein LOC132551610 [Ylistrum balloti]XP_060071767.1 uncharacterized protein LOC132551610 [Ylistrum balloti]XP_060071768.1 uncharacterized protein LOC132551610 [Ylistrum balloti]
MDIENLTKLLGKELQKGDDIVPIEEALKGKSTICLYFSAHWCPPCKKFTPVLAGVYGEKKDEDVEIVFISSDGDEADFNKYFKEMPWCAVPFKMLQTIKPTISEMYHVSGIPKLVFLKQDGSVDEEGRKHVQQEKHLHFK